MIVALLNRQPGVGKTTPVPHFASQSSRQGKQIALIDADLQGSTVDRFEQPGHRRFDRPIDVILVLSGASPDRRLPVPRFRSRYAARSARAKFPDINGWRS